MIFDENVFVSFTNSFVPHFCPSGTNDFQSRNSSQILIYKRGTLSVWQNAAVAKKIEGNSPAQNTLTGQKQLQKRKEVVTVTR